MFSRQNNNDSNLLRVPNRTFENTKEKFNGTTRLFINDESTYLIDVLRTLGALSRGGQSFSISSNNLYLSIHGWIYLDTDHISYIGTRKSVAYKRIGAVRYAGTKGISLCFIAAIKETLSRFAKENSLTGRVKMVRWFPFRATPSCPLYTLNKRYTSSSRRYSIRYSWQLSFPHPPPPTFFSLFYATHLSYRYR